MRIMFLNHSFVRHSATLEAHIRKLLSSYASAGHDVRIGVSR